MKPDQFMGRQSGSEAITAQRTSMLLYGWMRPMALALICGARMSPHSCYILPFEAYHRSTHNIRIERLWFDVTQGVGSKWKSFFLELELNHHLVRHYPTHIWLLHWLFFDSINEDIQEWAEAWNHHRISRRGQVDRSPRDLFIFSIIEDGVRGMAERVDEDVVNPDTYGVDWEAFDNSAIRTHLENADLEEEAGLEDPLDEEDEPCNSPFTEDVVHELEERLSGVVNMSTRNMTIRRLVWDAALNICRNLEQEHRLDRCDCFNWECAYLIRIIGYFSFPLLGYHYNTRN
jgi:hypothetical protein